MLWRDSTGFERRPIIVVEDHLAHVEELLTAIAAIRADLLPQTTVCVLERRGTDTVNATEAWLRTYPGVQIAAQADRPPDAGGVADPAVRRFSPIAAADLADANRCARLFARLVRPSGLFVQDIQLTTLAFLPADRWWESIYLAVTLRGLFAERPPTIRFLSNKRGYAATFGRDLIDAGMDPRDVMDKAELGSTVAPTFGQFLDRVFPGAIDLIDDLGRRIVRVAAGHDERPDIEDALDLVLWIDADRAELGGRLVAGAGGPRVVLRLASHETETWRLLVDDYLGRRRGLPVTTIGERVAPRDAGRAEMTNLASRHLHGLRGRLTDPGAIVTAEHAYRLRQGLSVGISIALRA